MSLFRTSRAVALAVISGLWASGPAAGQTTAPPSSPVPIVTSPAPRPPPPATAPAPADPATGKPADASGSQDAAPVELIKVTEADVERIQRHLQLPPTLKLDEQQLRFYVQILAKQQSFAQYAKGYDWRNGATKGGNPMTHQEFLDMVTPKELHSSGGITATELLQGAIVNWLGQALIKKALEDVSNAHSQHDLEAIRDRIDRELAALRKSGG